MAKLPRQDYSEDSPPEEVSEVQELTLRELRKVNADRIQADGKSLSDVIAGMDDMGFTDPEYSRQFRETHDPNRPTAKRPTFIVQAVMEKEQYLDFKKGCRLVGVFVSAVWRPFGFTFKYVYLIFAVPFIKGITRKR